MMLGSVKRMMTWCFLIDIQSQSAGETGRSEKLYSGSFIERDLMPRIMLGDLKNLIIKSGLPMNDMSDSHLES